MHHLSTEHRILNNPETLADNIARLICHYQVYGKAVVVTDQPQKMLADLKSAWLDLKREMREEVASTKNEERKALLTNQLMYMQYCSFTNTPPIEDPSEKVIVTTVEHVLEYAPLCQTMYITCPIEIDEVHRASAWMPPYGLLVFYDIEEDKQERGDGDKQQHGQEQP